MPLTRRNKGEDNPEPVLSKKEGNDQGDSFPVEVEEAPEGEGAAPETPGVVDVVINPPVVVIDEKDKKKDK